MQVPSQENPQLSSLPESPLRLCLLGAFSLQVRGEETPTLPRPTRWLLALLILRRQTSLSREWLAETLWPEATQERSAFYLRRSLTELRNALGSERHRLLSPTRATLTFDFTDAFCDVIAFDRLVEAEDVPSLERAVALYRGALLEKCDAEWALLERERRRERYIVVLERLAEQRETSEAIRLLRRVLEADPLREMAHRRLMQALGQAGDYTGVKRQYRELRRALRDELNMEPAQETVALYQRLMQSSRSRQFKQASPTPNRRIPHPLTSLIGRKACISEVGNLLRAERLLTLTGAGGIGKTRLALAVGEATSERWTDGVWWSDLASLAEPEHLALALLRAFGLEDSGNSSPKDVITAFLRERHALMVLDNCEHLVTECARLCAHLLGECERLHILATSREPLNITGETVWRVPALTVPTLPQAGAPFEAESVCGSEAVQLFTARANSANRDFHITHANGKAVACICRMLDGIPLALELAAVWVRSLTVEQIAERLTNSFALLEHGNRSAPPRHQTLQTLIEWSEALLEPQERTLFAQLAIFSGGWTLEAAEAVCASEPYRHEEITMLLNRLVEQSLVEVEQNAGETRYRFLETVRQFAYARLLRREEAVHLSERHRNYYLSFAQSLCSRLGKADSASLLDRLERERDNFRAAFASCQADNDPTDLELRLAAHLHRFFAIRGSLVEGIEVLQSALERRTGSPAVQAEGLYALGCLYYRMDENAASIARIEAALTLFREQALPQGEAEALGQLAAALVSMDQYDQARSYLQEGLALSRRIGARYEEARTVTLLGLIAKSEGDTQNAIALFAQAAQTLEEMGELEANGIVLHNWGNALLEQGDWRQARGFYERSLAIHRLLGKRTWIGFNLNVLALCCLKERDVEQARRLYEEISAYSQNVADQAIYNLYLAANIALQDNRLEEARDYLLQAFTMGHRLGMYRNLSYCFLTAGDIAQMEANWKQATRFLAIALQLREEIHAPFAAGDRQEIEASRTLLRSKLEEVAFEVEWQTGKGMSFENALVEFRIFCTYGCSS